MGGARNYCVMIVVVCAVLVAGTVAADSVTSLPPRTTHLDVLGLASARHADRQHGHSHVSTRWREAYEEVLRLRTSPETYESSRNMEDKRDFTLEETPSVPTQEPAIPTYAVEIQASGCDPNTVAATYDFSSHGSVGTLANTYVFHYDGDMAQLAANEAALQSDACVIDVRKQLGRLRNIRSFLDAAVPREVVPRIKIQDPVFSDQWHLRNIGQVKPGFIGNDINVVPAWDNGITGAGVTIGVVDTRIPSHPDLDPTHDTSLDLNLPVDVTLPPIGSDDIASHGTSVAGVAVAAGNTICGRGVAFGSQFAAIGLLSTDFQTDVDEAMALGHSLDDIHVFVNGWGPTAAVLEGPDLLAHKQIMESATTGRGGKGSVFVWAGGNEWANREDNVNHDGYANRPEVIAVAASDFAGVRTPYSEPGACILVTAPGGGEQPYEKITTTGLGTPGVCRSDFIGTSAAAANVAGVVALMLEANGNLGWRDVQNALIQTARKIDDAPADAFNPEEWVQNGIGLPIHHFYGFGLVDAESAVSLVSNAYENLPPRQSWCITGAVATAPGVGPNGEPSWCPDLDSSGGIALPDATGSGTGPFTPGEQTFTVTSNMIDFVMEHVEVRVNIGHELRGDLRITLKSPNGTESILTDLQVEDVTDEGYNNWQFMTVRNWGESPLGTWTLKVEDLLPGFTGTFFSWQLLVHGHDAPAKTSLGSVTGLTAAPRTSNLIELTWDNQDINQEECVHIKVACQACVTKACTSFLGGGEELECSCDREEMAMTDLSEGTTYKFVVVADYKEGIESEPAVAEATTPVCSNGCNGAGICVDNELCACTVAGWSGNLCDEVDCVVMDDLDASSVVIYPGVDTLPFSLNDNWLRLNDKGPDVQGTTSLHDKGMKTLEKTVTFLAPANANWDYQVSLRWTGNRGRPDNVPVRVKDSQGAILLDERVNQQVAVEDGWHVLGDQLYYFSGGGSIVVSNLNTRGLVAADAARICPFNPGGQAFPFGLVVPGESCLNVYYQHQGDSNPGAIILNGAPFSNGQVEFTTEFNWLYKDSFPSPDHQSMIIFGTGDKRSTKTYDPASGWRISIENTSKGWRPVVRYHTRQCGWTYFLGRSRWVCKGLPRIFVHEVGDSLQPNTWYHMAATYIRDAIPSASPGTFCLWVNGQKACRDDPLTYLYVDSRSAFGFFGCRNCLLTDLRIWKSVRTDAEIADAMNRRLVESHKFPTLLAYLKLNQAPVEGRRGYTIQDEKNRNTGTIFGNVPDVIFPQTLCG